MLIDETTVVVVTGASSGIGWATALAFASRGAIVVPAARRVDRLETLADFITAKGGTALPLACDVSQASSLDLLAAAVLEQFGRCDVLVNNAGVPGGGAFAGLSAEQIQHVVQVNVIGIMQGCRAFLPAMTHAGRGHVLNVASLAGRHATPGAALYTATKHAVTSFSEALALEMRPQGVRVTAINPGFTTTEGFPQHGMPGRIVMQPPQVARAMVRAVERNAGHQVSVPRWTGALELGRATGPAYRFVMRRMVSERSRMQPTEDLR